MRHLRHKNHSVGKKQFAQFFLSSEFAKLLATYIKLSTIIIIILNDDCDKQF